MTIVDALLHREHRAWQAVCLQLRNASASIDINDEDALHAAIVLWAEELVALRMTQGREAVDTAYDEARKLYNQQIGFLPY